MTSNELYAIIILKVVLWIILAASITIPRLKEKKDLDAIDSELFKRFLKRDIVIILVFLIPLLVCLVLIPIF